MSASSVPLSFVAFCAVLIALSMPHLHSSAARAARLARARDRGFLLHKPADKSFLLVDSVVKAPLRIMSAAAEAHFRLDSISGIPRHFLSHAALAAKPYVSAKTYRDALVLNKAAGAAKHNLSVHSGRPSWCDLTDDLDIVPPLPSLLEFVSAPVPSKDISLFRDLPPATRRELALVTAPAPCKDVSTCHVSPETPADTDPPAQPDLNHTLIAALVPVVVSAVSTAFVPAIEKIIECHDSNIEKRIATWREEFVNLTASKAEQVTVADRKFRAEDEKSTQKNEAMPDPENYCFATHNTLNEEKLSDCEYDSDGDSIPDLAPILPKPMDAVSEVANADYLAGVFAPVRLAGLAASHLNGMIGHALGMQENRVKVKLIKDDSVKLVKPSNVYQYHPATDVCETCEGLINLFEFPRCSCADEGTPTT